MSSAARLGMSKHKHGRRLQVVEPPPYIPGTEAPWMHTEMGHRGHGPKNYRRSDERIREEVCELLTRLDGVDARYIDVVVEGGAVTLVGSVASHTMKVIALEAVAATHGVTHVNDRLIEHAEVEAQTAK